MRTTRHLPSGSQLRIRLSGSFGALGGAPGLRPAATQQARDTEGVNGHSDPGAVLEETGARGRRLRLLSSRVGVVGWGSHGTRLPSGGASRHRIKDAIARPGGGNSVPTWMSDFRSCLVRPPTMTVEPSIVGVGSAVVRLGHGSGANNGLRRSLSELFTDRDGHLARGRAVAGMN
jgi:hypothetical protein